MDSERPVPPGEEPAAFSAHRLAFRLPLYAALFLSGTAGLVNQVVWQRALKVYLGGSEALSTMTVVLVFLLGLGFGSWLLSRCVHRVRRPGGLFAGIELGLFAVNVLIALVLSLDLSASVFSFQQTAMALGVPLRLTYAAVALLVLAVPCTLMGMTIPLVAEICQRLGGSSGNGTISILFFVNTLGAVLGALGSGFLLLPYLGQFASLLIAATANAVAGAVVLLMWNFGAVTEPRVMPALRPRSGEARVPVAEDWLGLVLGLLSLGYEMYLFRVMTLLYWPLPYTFATTLCLFLLFWSLGVFASSRWTRAIIPHGLLGALLVAGMPLLYHVHRWELEETLLHGVLGIVYFLPCVVFGSLYGQMVSRRAVSWGHDVGLFSALNTAGSCLGIVLFTLVGYEMDVAINAWVIAAGVLGVLGGVKMIDMARASAAEKTAVAGRRFGWNRWGTAPLLAGGLAAMLVARGLSNPYVEHSNGIRSYYGKDGVVELRPDGTMIWDGLDHSRLRRGEEYIGDNNWSLAAVPVMCHSGPVEEALVIGLGCGATAHVLSGMEELQIDVYDINGTLRRILDDFPEGTFGLTENEQVRIEWRDGRTGLALNPKQYDIITQQPLYLMQAGSGILLSREYFELVRSRLKPGGVFCAYTYDLENGSQSLLVRQTAQQVFRHCESFWNGWLIVASDEPLDLDPESWKHKRMRRNRLYAEIRAFDRTAPRRERPTLFEACDHRQINWDSRGRIVTDDHPLVEYPAAAKRLVEIPAKGVTR
jgi:spermidine synthase